MNAPRFAVGLLPALLLALSQTGCTAILPTFGPAGEETLAAAVGSCTVELKSEGSATRSEEVPVTEGMHLQDVAEASGAARKYRNMEGYVLRAREDGSRFQMKARWDPSHRSFTLDTDYAIQPGDRVVFIQQPNVLDGMLNKLLGPMGG